MSEVRPIHLPGSSALSVLTDRARTALAGWTRDWVTGECRLGSLTIDSVGAGDLELSRDFQWLQGDHGWIGFRRSPLDRASFGLAVAGDGLMPRSIHADDWIADIIDDAWALRNRALCEALVGAPQAAQPTDVYAGAANPGKRGSGAVMISSEPLGLHAVADAGVWTLMPPAERRDGRRPPLVPLGRATRRARLHLDVLLGEAELELPKVLDLRRGDVLRLSQRLDQPLTVSCACRPFARALLGADFGSKCIQFTGAHS